MIQQKDTDVWTYLKKPIRTLMDRATGMVYFSENGEVNLNVVRNEYGEAQSLETLCDEEVRQELSEYAPEYLFSEDKLKQKKSSITGNLLPGFGKSICQTAISHLMKMAISCTMTSWSATLLTDQTVIFR